LLFLLFAYTSSASEACIQDDQCISLNLCINKECKHKTVFPLSVSEIIGLFGIIIGSALSNAGGIGGGGLLIPLLILVLNFYTGEAIPISKLMIFSGAVTSFILGFRQKHPFRESITIDYNIPLLLVPMLLFGTMVGVTLNKVTPPWLILVNLTLILVINTYKTMKKGVELYKKENDTRVVSSDVEMKTGVPKGSTSFDYNVLAENEENKRNSINNSMDSKKVTVVETKSDFTSNPNISSLKEEELKDMNKLPMNKIGYMLLSYLIMLVITLLKGSNYSESIIQIKSCSFPYWLLYITYLPIALFLTYKMSTIILAEYNYRISINYPYNKHDVVWCNKIFIKYPIYSFVSGVMAGMLGIGGGLILGPLLLELGLHPLVSTATSNFLVLFTSSSTSFQFIIFGMMNYDFGLACTICASVGSFVGTLIIQRIVERTKRVSFIVIVLGGVLGVSTLLIPSYTLYTTIQQLNAGKNIWNFSSPC
jgi:uncharacterized membrane protein YfcA